MPDHLGDQLSPIPALVAAADATSMLRVGSRVFDNDFRHPVMLAKEAATLDVLSGVRLELGVGGGWLKPEYERAGIPFERVSVRIARMEEAIQIVKGLFADGPIDFAGQYFTLTGLEGSPKPVQRPHPPLHIGGGDQLSWLLPLSVVERIVPCGRLLKKCRRKRGSLLLLLCVSCTLLFVATVSYLTLAQSQDCSLMLVWIQEAMSEHLLRSKK
jgi:hypothetical protein